MGTRIKIAKSARDIQDLLAVRHKVFVEEDGYCAPQGGYMVDRFDALPTAPNMVVVAGEEIVGGLRLVEDSEAGTPADEMFEFRNLFSEEIRPVSCSMLCLRKAHRGRPKLISGLLLMAAYWARARGNTHVFAPVNPMIRAVMRRAGMVIVGDEFVHEESGLPTLPMVMDLAKMRDSFIDFIDRQQVVALTESFEREFFSAGETIIQRGEPGHEAFVLVQGDLRVEFAKGEEPPGSPRPIAQGEIFGELALLTSRARSVSVIAETDVEVMVIEKASFEAQLMSDSSTAIAMLRTISQRLSDAHHDHTGPP